MLKVGLIRPHYPIIFYIAIEYLLAECFRYYVTITRESLTVDEIALLPYYLGIQSLIGDLTINTTLFSKPAP